MALVAGLVPVILRHACRAGLYQVPRADLDRALSTGFSGRPMSFFGVMNYSVTNRVSNNSDPSDHTIDLRVRSSRRLDCVGGLASRIGTDGTYPASTSSFVVSRFRHCTWLQQASHNRWSPQRIALTFYRANCFSISPHCANYVYDARPFVTVSRTLKRRLCTCASTQMCLIACLIFSPLRCGRT